jgi:hypothetical protein
VLTLRIWLLIATATLESWSKGSSSALHQHHHPSSYEKAGFLNRAVFWWMIDPIIHTTKLEPIELPPNLGSRVARSSIISSWDKYGQINPRMSQRVPDLVKSLLWAIRSPFVGAIPTRILLIFCRYTQPALIAISIDCVNGRRSDQIQPSLVVASAAVIYTSLAVRSGRRSSNGT